jgi:Ca2+-binding EF-hand superfamily protein
MNEFSELFDVLDQNQDGLLNRPELFRTAVELGWQGPQAHLYALLDFLAIRSPLDRESFVACLDQVSRERGRPDNRRFLSSLTLSPTFWPASGDLSV